MFATFAKEDANFQSTLHLLPGALDKTGNGLGKLATASDALGPDAARAASRSRRRSRPPRKPPQALALKTTPIIKNEIRPFAREILPVVNELAPVDRRNSPKPSRSSPTSFAVLNEFFNELAYNPGPSKAGFLFFLDWGNHNLNSVVSTADANGPLGRSLIYFNCEVAADPQRRLGSQPDRQPAGRPAAAADEGRMRQPGILTREPPRAPHASAAAHTAGSSHEPRSRRRSSASVLARGTPAAAAKGAGG